MLDLVSVIITTYMRPWEIVLRAIESVRRQTFQNLEIIVVDDSPSDCEFRTLLKEKLVQYGSEIIYIQHEQNMGACAARNTGLKVASGRYVAFLDDDDEWLPDKIEQQISKFLDDEVALVYCGKSVINDSTGETENNALVEHSGYVFDQLIYNNFIGSTSFPLLKTESLIKIGGFDPLMKSAQDYDVWLRMAKEYKVSYVNKPLVLYHVHDGERISTNYQARISGQERLIQKNIDYLRQYPKAWWWRLLRLSLQYSQNKQLTKALRVWMNACVKRPLNIVINSKYFLLILYYYVKKKT